jgi:hypothetical protein
MSKREEMRRHKAKVAAKYAKVEGLEALVQTYEAMTEPDTDYIRQLKAKLRTARCNLQAMTTDYSADNL